MKFEDTEYSKILWPDGSLRSREDFDARFDSFEIIKELHETLYSLLIRDVWTSDDIGAPFDAVKNAVLSQKLATEDPIRMPKTPPTRTTFVFSKYGLERVTEAQAANMASERLATSIYFFAELVME